MLCVSVCSCSWWQGRGGKSAPVGVIGSNLYIFTEHGVSLHIKSIAVHACSHTCMSSVHVCMQKS